MPKINWGETPDAEDYEDFLEKSVKTRKKGKKEKRFKKDKLSQFITPMISWKHSLEKNGFAARIVEVHKRYSFVSPILDEGKINTKDVWLATVSRKHLTASKDERNFVCVGDVVLCLPAEEKDGLVTTDIPQCVITQMAPRQSKIARIDPHKQNILHVLASNIDQLIIVASYTKPTVKWGLIDRYLVLAFYENILPIIILNKADLLSELSEESARENRARRDYLKSLGYIVLEMQGNDASKCDEEVQKLGALLADKVSLFSGHSGVGKSSIVNLYDPEIEQEVEPDEDIFYKGRHTTTYASLLRLKKVEGYIVDTPGIRSFCIAEPDAVTLNHAFPDILPLASRCEFRMCRHVDEPNCGVKDAVHSGLIPEYRLRSYHGILLGATGREGRMRDLATDDE